MDLALTDEQAELQRTLRRFLESDCTKQWLDDLESKEEYPFGLYEAFAEMGLFGIGVAEEDGGAGGGMIEIASCARNSVDSVAPST